MQPDMSILCSVNLGYFVLIQEGNAYSFMDPIVDSSDFLTCSAIQYLQIVVGPLKLLFGQVHQSLGRGLGLTHSCPQLQCFQQT